MSAKKRVQVEIEGRTLQLSNLDKVLYPKAGFTKAHVIDYYRQISPVLLPHLAGRPITLKRYPDGVEGPFFYEKSCPVYRPDWLHTTPVYSETRGEDIEFCVFDDLPSLVWAANLADLELHTYLHRGEDTQTPTAMVFDLDPGPGTSIVECAEVALVIRDMLKDFGLQCFAKTSGSKGMQFYVPVNTPTSYEQTKPLARMIGEVVERDQPDRVTTNMKKVEREGRVFIDWSQNDDHKTTVCVYSLRAKEAPTVSTPLTWKEVERLARSGDPALGRFEVADVLARVEKHGDLFEPVLTMEQTLPVLD